MMHRAASRRNDAIIESQRMATLEKIHEQPVSGGAVLLNNVGWELYQALRDEAENRHVRMTYDQGMLEMMSPSKQHERVAYLLGRFIDVWTEERNIAVQSCRTTTFRRDDQQRALEPDNCYYIRHESRVRDREQLDLSIDPPPDLAIEIDVTSPSVNRLSIYAAIGVPEVWRWRQEGINVYELQGDAYQLRAGSGALPGFPINEAAATLARRLQSDDNTLTKSFRSFVRSMPSDGAGQGSP